MDDLPKGFWRIVNCAGVTVLTCLCGMGAAWVISALLLKKGVIKNDGAVLHWIMPVLIAGGVVGFVAGLVISIWMTRLNEKEGNRLYQKFVGPDGKLNIYFGLPIFVVIALAMTVFGRLNHIIGQKLDIYVDLGIALVILAVSLFFYDRIPGRLVIPVGIIGWLLTLALVIWFCFFGPGAFGHSSF
jgi:hypothetical protein